jgi:hypothetical protein
VGDLCHNANVVKVGNCVVDLEMLGNAAVEHPKAHVIVIRVLMGVNRVRMGMRVKHISVDESSFIVASLHRGDSVLHCVPDVVAVPLSSPLVSVGNVVVVSAARVEAFPVLVKLGMGQLVFIIVFLIIIFCHADKELGAGVRAVLWSWDCDNGWMRRGGWAEGVVEVGG